MELLQFLYQQRPSVAQREYSHRRRHERPPIPGYPRWRDRLEYVSPYFGPVPLGPAGKRLVTNWIYRAQPVPYDWVPPGTPHGERAVVAPDLTTFRVPAER